MKNRYWFWHCDGLDFIDFIYDFEHKISTEFCLYGPFETLELAKKDALAYYKTDLQIIKDNIRRIKEATE